MLLHQSISPVSTPAERGITRAPGFAGRLGFSRESLRGSGIVIASYAVVWGVWVAWPTFDVFRTSPIYQHYRDYPEWLWGVYALASGLLQWAGIRRHLSLLAFAGSLFLTAFFLFGAWNFLLADSRSPGVPLLLLLMFWEVLIADSKARTAPNLVRSAAALFSGASGTSGKGKHPAPETRSECGSEGRVNAGNG